MRVGTLASCSWKNYPRLSSLCGTSGWRLSFLLHVRTMKTEVRHTEGKLPRPRGKPTLESRLDPHFCAPGTSLLSAAVWLSCLTSCLLSSLIQKPHKQPEKKPHRQPSIACASCCVDHRSQQVQWLIKELTAQASISHTFRIPTDSRGLQRACFISSIYF